MISNVIQQNVSKNHEQLEMLRSLQRSPPVLASAEGGVVASPLLLSSLRPWSFDRDAISENNT
ncbi:hypothetical protein GQ55_1G364700 [Panicum hallii var. hallii]|uniref:Uncharacterized protein n=1 Tax=Panicum hallii var. hallii TaxID=1504633 RepID=A0A2T7FBA8_9POAL|nr:hypothetical protein GQ55_1G364700 [Panicum hallii var. hallii]